MTPAPVKKHLLVIRATKVRLAPWQDTPLKTILTDRSFSPLIMINKLYITRNSPQWYMESAVDFSRDLKRIKGYWSLPKSPSAVNLSAYTEGLNTIK